MIKATLDDKPIVVDILTRSFEFNSSINYLIDQDRRKHARLRLLMEYAFHTCLRSGEILLSNNKKGCAVLLYPDKQRITFQSILWDIKVALFAIGPKNIVKAINRESKIKKRHPKFPFAYLWFIGVNPESQRMGIGSSLLGHILDHIRAQNRSMFLETSVVSNVEWYEKFGFKKYDELDLGYRLFFLQRK